jgi:hypothetical protein
MEMYNVFRAIILSSLSIAIFVFVGCGTPTPEATYPALSDIPPIPDYADSGRSWNTDAVCWVGMTDDAKWESDLPSTSPGGIQWVRQNTPKTVQRLIREELESEGYEVKVFADDYLTRHKRLMLNRLILFEAFDIKKTMIKEGACFDMKLTVKVVDNPDLEQSTQCEIWGRSLVLGDETKNWEDILKDCVRNMRKAPQFRKALELNPKVSGNSS